MIQIKGPISIKKKGVYFEVSSNVDISFSDSSFTHINLPLNLHSQLSWCFYPNPKFIGNNKALSQPITNFMQKRPLNIQNLSKINIQAGDILGYFIFFRPVLIEEIFPQESQLVGIVIGNQQQKYLNRQISGNLFYYGPYSLQTTIYFKKKNNFMNFFVGKQNYLSENPMTGQFSQVGFNHAIGSVIDFIIRADNPNQVKLYFQGDSIQFRNDTLYLSSNPTTFFLYQQPSIVFSSRFISSSFKYFAPIGIIGSSYAYSSFVLTPLQISIDGNQIEFLFSGLPINLQVRNNRLYLTSQIKKWFVQIISQTVIYIKNQQGLYLAQTGNQNFTLQQTHFAFQPPHQRYSYLTHSQNQNKFLTRYGSKNFRFRNWSPFNPIFDKQLQQFIGVNFYVDQAGIIRQNDGISRPISWKLVYEGNHRYSLQLLSNNKFLCIRKRSGGVTNFDYWPWFDTSIPNKVFLSFYDRQKIPQQASFKNFARILPINLSWKRKFNPQRIILISDLNSTNQQLFQFNYFSLIQDNDFYQLHTKIPLNFDFNVLTMQNMYANIIPNQSHGGSVRIFLKNIRQRAPNTYQSQFWCKTYQMFPLVANAFGQLEIRESQQGVTPFKLRFYLQNTLDNNQYGVWGDNQKAILKINNKLVFDDNGYPLKMKNVGDNQYIFGQLATQNGDIYQNQPVSLWQKFSTRPFDLRPVYVIPLVAGNPSGLNFQDRLDKYDSQEPPKIFAISSRPQLFVISRSFNFLAECSPPIINDSPFTLKFFDQAFKNWQTMSFIDPTSDIF